MPRDAFGILSRDILDIIQDWLMFALFHICLLTGLKVVTRFLLRDALGFFEILLKSLEVGQNPGYRKFEQYG